MAAQYKTIHPVKYYRDYLAHDVRPDGRGLLGLRPVAVNVGFVATADGSAIVKIGDTVVICGIKAELTTPAPAEPDVGFLIPNVELPALCSSKFRPGPPSDQAQVSSHFMAELVENSGCVDLHKLCVAVDKLAWVLYCDIICLNHDGSLLDACVAALLAALHTVTLPHVEYDSSTEQTTVLPSRKTQLDVLAHPAATTYAVFDDDTLIADPTAEEENLSSGVLTVVVEGGRLCSVHKPGGSPLTDEQLQRCITLAHKRGAAVEGLIQAALCCPER